MFITNLLLPVGGCQAASVDIIYRCASWASATSKITMHGIGEAGHGGGLSQLGADQLVVVIQRLDGRQRHQALLEVQEGGVPPVLVLLLAAAKHGGNGVLHAASVLEEVLGVAVVEVPRRQGAADSGHCRDGAGPQDVSHGLQCLNPSHDEALVDSSFRAFLWEVLEEKHFISNGVPIQRDTVPKLQGLGSVPVVQRLHD